MYQCKTEYTEINSEYKSNKNKSGTKNKVKKSAKKEILSSLKKAKQNQSKSEISMKKVKKVLKPELEL